MKKKIIKLTAVTAALILVIISPLGAYGRSLAVMSIYSESQYVESFMSERGIDIEMPSGRGWYPFVMTYNADCGFSRFTAEKNRRLTIMYNFPSFDIIKGCSRLYDPNSSYYSSFYGAYCTDGQYGFTEDGRIDKNKAGIVPEYDYTYLVLRDLGMPLYKQIFQWETRDERSDISIAGYDGWYRVDADMLVNGLAHNKTEYLRNYVQYGVPDYDIDEDFAVAEMKGVVIGKYFEECDVSVFFYIMTGSEELIEYWQKDILENTSIKITAG